MSRAKPSEKTSRDTRLEWMPIGTLQSATRNPKQHSPEIGTSIGRFGYVEPIVLDERTGRIVAGHGRREALLAMRARGEAPPAGIRAEGDEWLVPVLRGWASRSDAEAEAYLLASNKLTEAGGWDNEALAELLKDLGDQGALDGVGFTQDEVDALLGGLDGANGGTEGLTDPDDVPDEASAADVYVKPGDIWSLGKHRILCGDSTDPANVRCVMAGERASLMATDPPYLVDYDGTNHPQGYKAKETSTDPNKQWDEYTDPESAVSFFQRFLEAAIAEALTERPFVYQWFASMRADLVLAAWRNAGLLPHQQLIWKKSRIVLTRCDFLWDYEPCMYGWIKGKRPPTELAPPNTARTVWEIDSRIEDGAKNIHPTMKPVEVVKRPIEYHTKPGQLIFEPFSGSGTAIIAAEMTGRCCRAIELSPTFVQVAIERWQTFTGQKAARA
jgi:DNA modification methylase